MRTRQIFGRLVQSCGLAALLFFGLKLPDREPDVVILPKQEAIDLVAYLQWLGNQVSSRSGTTFDPSAIVMPPKRRTSRFPAVRCCIPAKRTRAYPFCANG